MPHARSACSGAACFRAQLYCLYTTVMRGCSLAVQRGACCVHNCHRIRRCGTRWQLLNYVQRGLMPAARMIRLLCRGSFSCKGVMILRSFDALVQLCCLAGCVLCAQLRRQSAFEMVLAIAGLQARLGLVPRARAVYPAAVCLHARSQCLCVMVMCGCSFAVQRGAHSLHSCVTRARLRWRWQLPE